MSKNSPEPHNSTSENSIELDIATVSKMIWRTSPGAFVAMLTIVAGSIAFTISKYYDLKNLIAETNSEIKILHNKVDLNIEIIKAKLDSMKEKEDKKDTKK